MSILTKLLQKRGIDKVQDLSAEERIVFDQYQAVLSGEKVTIEALADFCKQQIKVIETKCDGVTPLTNIQQASLHVYLTLVKAIESPEAERAALEQHLTQVITSND